MYEKNALLSELLQNRDIKNLKKELALTNEVDIAEFITELSREQTLVVFRILDKDICAEVFANLDPDSRQQIIEAFTDAELKPLIEDLFVDDAVDMLGELPAGMVKRVLRNATAETRETINRFLNYPDGSAGSIMTAELVDVKAEMTVGEVIAQIRETGIDKETVYCCYVTDATRRLTGVLSFKELLYAPDDDLIAEVMTEEVISVSTSDTAEHAAAVISKYNFLAVPVVDAELRLCGIVTHDDALDVMKEEATEDFHKMAAVTPLEKPYLKTSVLELYKNRIPWLILLMFSSMISGFIIGRFEPIIALMPMLVAFMPMITATGGNAGAQSSTLIIRDMATGDICPRDVLRVALRETACGAVCGIALGTVNMLRVIITHGITSDMLLTAGLTSLSIVAAVVIACAVGGLLPLLARALNLDPALFAAPLITTIVDALSILLFYSAATAIFIG